MEIEHNNPFRGYRRLSFFKFRLWQVILLIMLICILAVLMFPKDRILVSLYMEREMSKEAARIISKMLEEKPDDPELLLLSAITSEMNGDTGQAIKTIEQAANKNPNNLTILMKLAGYYEGTRRLRDAALLWESAVILDPLNIEVTAKLIEHYRYYDLSQKESLSIIHWLNIEQALPPEKVILCAGNPEKVQEITSNRMYVALSWALKSLVKNRSLMKLDDPYLHELLSGLYLLRASLVKDLCEKINTYKIITQEDLVAALELFVVTGKIEMGMLFARYLDKAWGSNIDKRLLYARLVRENGLYGPAMTVLSALQKEYPGNSQLRQEIKSVEAEVVVAPAAGLPETVIKEEIEEGSDVYDALTRVMSLSKFTERDFGKVLDLLAAITEDRKTVFSTLSKILAKKPRSIAILERAAELYLWIERPDRAYYVYKRVVAINPGEKRHVLKMLELADSTGKTGIMTEASQYAWKLYPKDPAILLRVATTFLASEKQREAIAAYRAYLRLRPDDQKVQKKLVQLYMWTGQAEKAKELFTDIAGAGRGNKKSLLEAARFAEQVGLTGAAHDIYTKLSSQYPGDRHISGKLARGAPAAPEVRESPLTYGSASNRDPGNFEKAVRAGDAYVTADQLMTGIRYLERALALRPNDIDLRKKMARYYGWAGNTDQAIVQLEYLHSRGAVDETGKITLAQAYLDRKDGAGALKILKEYEQKSPLPFQEGIMLARSYELSGRVDSAVRIYRQMALENANDPEQLTILGNHALWLDQIDLAGDIYEAVLKKDPRNLTALKGSAQTYAWNNDAERAIKRFEEYNKLNPNDFEVRYQLGELYFQNGRQGDAFTEYQKASKLMKKVETRKE